MSDSEQVFMQIGSHKHFPSVMLQEFYTRTSGSDFYSCITVSL